MKKNLFVAFLIVISLCSYAQDLSGFWKGTLTMPGGCFPINYIELQLTVAGTTVRGDSYHYLDADNFIKKKCTGSYDPSTKLLTVQEVMVTELKIPQNCVVCIKKYKFTYSKRDTVETLEGGWTGHIDGTLSPCQPGTIVLSRIKESFFKEEQVRTIKVDTGKIHLDFYDNAEIDGDSISVLVNKRPVTAHQLLGIKPVGVDVMVDLSNPIQEVEMVAENLGSIPPNTALLVITAGKKRYRLYMASTETKSAKVRFVYDGKQPDD